MGMHFKMAYNAILRIKLFIKKNERDIHTDTDREKREKEGDREREKERKRQTDRPNRHGHIYIYSIYINTWTCVLDGHYWPILLWQLNKSLHRLRSVLLREVDKLTLKGQCHKHQVLSQDGAPPPDWTLEKCIFCWKSLHPKYSICWFTSVESVYFL